MNIIRQFFCRLQGNRGSILLITFWALSFLSFFAVIMGATARQKMTLAERLNRRSQLRLIAQAGIERGIWVLKKPDADPDTDSFKEPWASKTFLRNISLGDGFFDVAIVDEERKININTADVGLLKTFFKVSLDCSDVDAEQIADAIVDWRDQDAGSLAEGAEDNFYAGLEHPYDCKDAPFAYIDELLLVRGITATIYESVKDYLTVFGSGAININTAPRIILLALGLDEKLADKLLAYRAGEDGLEGTEDDRYFSSVGNIGAMLEQIDTLQSQEAATLSNLAASGRIGVASNNFLITSSAGYEYKKGSAVIVCALERLPLEEEPGYKGKIRHWRINHG